jgi:alpha-L-rhamnosidase
MLPDGTINPGQMTSFNHYALGAVADWVHRTIGGIAPLEPGYSRVLVAPQPGGGLTWARASLETRHGPVAVSWRQNPADGFTLDVELPGDVGALVRLPDGTEHELSGGQHQLASR